MVLSHSGRDISSREKSWEGWEINFGRNSLRLFFFFSSRRRHTRWPRDWSSDVCSSDLEQREGHESQVEDHDEVGKQPVRHSVPESPLFAPLAGWCYGRSTISFFIGPSAASSSFFSRSGDRKSVV